MQTRHINDVFVTFQIGSDIEVCGSMLCGTSFARSEKKCRAGFDHSIERILRRLIQVSDLFHI